MRGGLTGRGRQAGAGTAPRGVGDGPIEPHRQCGRGGVRLIFNQLLAGGFLHVFNPLRYQSDAVLLMHLAGLG